jgi:hypothetical protein
MSPPSPIRLAFLTLKAFVARFVLLSGLFMALGAIAIDRCIRLGPLEPFRIGTVDIPNFTGARASNLSVAILCATAAAVIVAGFAARYLRYAPFLAKLRARGVTDIDQDGKPDVFTDRFLDDL